MTYKPRKLYKKWKIQGDNYTTISIKQREKLLKDKGVTSNIQLRTHGSIALFVSTFQKKKYQGNANSEILY